MAFTASEVRAKLFPLIEQVNDDEKAIRITSKNGNAVLMSESEYELSDVSLETPSLNPLKSMIL